jgi:hypothetical protein
MTHPTHIRNWLTIGIQQPVGSMNEDFYYDKKNNQFFSIVLTDQFMLDANLNLANDVTTTYTKNQENSIIDRLRRIKHNDPTIISIERISLDERKFVMQQFVDNLTNHDLTKILQQRIYNQDYKTKFDFYFEVTRQNWEQQKSFFLQQKVDTFLNLNNIKIDTVTLWDVEANGSITLDLTKNDEVNNDTIEDTIERKKPWWKFW